MYKIGPSILGYDDKVELVTKLISFGIDRIHYDLMDGNFVDNNSLPNDELLNVINNTPTHLKDFHMMVNDPVKYFSGLPIKPDFCSMHFDQVKNDEANVLKMMEDKNVKWGLAINPEYDLDSIKHIIDRFDYILIMSVKAGYGGQSFIESTILKIYEIVDYIFDNNLNIDVQVDGGVNNETIEEVVLAGADVIVVGSYLQKNLSQTTVDDLYKYND